MTAGSIPSDNPTPPRGERADIAEVLAEAIFSGDYAIGETIPREVDLCARFGVSRSTVRSALQKLVNVGLLVRVSGQGTRVCELATWHLLDPQVSAWMARYAQPNPRLQREVFAFRLAVEPFVAGLAARHATAADLLAIETAYEGMINALTQPDLRWQGRSHDDYDVAFHEAIFAASHNLIWAQISHVLKPAIALIVERSNSRATTHGAVISGDTAESTATPGPVTHSAPQLDDSMARHFRMMEAIRLRQPETAAEAALSVLERTGRDLGMEDLTRQPFSIVLSHDTLATTRHPGDLP
ncbi:FadR/GntR family transcriptional regulator [Salinicola avicenniae]|uniref:FadR/GntR family transcriptional regulator n=1 Tax=Salinicola avicenniae TaxID=2916836 RepID=UPI0020731350|nr:MULTISPECIES: GntR family transcriptional regulator [unclassified Salinicola]